MIAKIKNYFRLRKMRKDAATLLLINGAEMVASLKNIVSMLEKVVSNHGNAMESISKDDVAAIVNFANEITSNPQLKDEMFEKIHDDAQKLREMEAGK